MDIMMIGSINQYVKRTELKQVWKLRQENKDMSKGKMTLDQWVQTQQDKTKAPPAQARPPLPEQPDVKLGSIEAKVNSGKRLSSAERSYLLEHSPELLKRAEENEQAQKNFERELKQCRTQEDVKRLKLKYASMAITRIKSIEHNSNIPQAKKLEICLQENGKLMAVERAAAAHVRSGAYAKLPTEAEQHAAQQAEQAREEALWEQNAETPVEPTEHNSRPEEIEAVQPEAAPGKENQSNVQPETQDEQKVKRSKAASYLQRINAANTGSFTPVQPQRFTPPSAPSFPPQPENSTPTSSEWPCLDTRA